MAIDTEDEIRADFLAEAGDLVERLGEQLMQLEQNPEDRELLNAVFRGFHTIKGGAGFLALTPMVTLCHVAEDIFNALRSGALAIVPSLMDAVLEALELLQTMLRATGARKPLPEVPEALLQRLHLAARASDVGAPAVLAAPALTPTAPAHVAAVPNTNTISDDEFEALLDQYQGAAPAAVAAPSATEAVVDAAPSTARAPTKQPGEHAAVPSQNTPEQVTRVDTAVLDDLMNLVGELVLTRNRLLTLCTRGSQEPHARMIGELDHITRGLQVMVMRARMQPIRRVFARFPRLARDIARGLGKQVEVELAGEETGLDKNLVEALADPLLHMVRNSVDHGIEAPEVRRAAGKPATGHLRLAAQQTGDHILITVSDDGAGIDPERLRRKAIEKGLLDATDTSRMSASECLQLVFLPGLSTREQVSDLSGRGVGMDVVKSSITALGGTVQIESRIGAGTQILIRVPLTLAIMPALMVEVGPRTVAMPLTAVLDVLVLDPTRQRRLDRWDVLLYGDAMLRLIDLHRWMETAAIDPARRHVVVASVGAERYGFVLSAVHGRQEVVVKPFGALLRGLPGLSGATITGDGRVALILDLAGIVDVVLGRAGD